MRRFFELLVGANSRPIRRTIAARGTVDEEGNPTIEPIEGDGVMLSEDDSIDRVVLRPESFYHCGHSAALIPAGGRCSECRQVSCRDCFRNCRCDRCDRPTCLEHIHQLEDDKGRIVGRYCRTCYDPRERRRVALAIARAILRPFHEDLKRERR